MQWGGLWSCTYTASRTTSRSIFVQQVGAATSKYFSLPNMHHASTLFAHRWVCMLTSCSVPSVCPLLQQCGIPPSGHMRLIITLVNKVIISVENIYVVNGGPDCCVYRLTCIPPARVRSSRRLVAEKLVCTSRRVASFTQPCCFMASAKMKSTRIEALAAFSFCTFAVSRRHTVVLACHVGRTLLHLVGPLHHERKVYFPTVLMAVACTAALRRVCDAPRTALSMHSTESELAPLPFAIGRAPLLMRNASPLAPPRRSKTDSSELSRGGGGGSSCR